jgi:GAF domain-containing protein
MPFQGAGLAMVYLNRDEESRLEALRRYHILDTAPEESFDGITRLASYICKTPISLISFIDGDRQWFKSKVGLTIDQTVRAVSFCDLTIKCDGIMEVADATKHSILEHNPLVVEEPFIRFYAGVPLVSRDGFAVGTLNVIDMRPRRLDEGQKNALEILAREVVALLELRVDSIHRAILNRRLEEQITDRERAEGALLESEARWRLLTNVLPALV